MNEAMQENLQPIYFPYKTFEKGEVVPEGFCTYNFRGYEVQSKRCENSATIYYLTGEYERVAQYLYEDSYPLWLYYNYINRLVVSEKDTIEFGKEFKTFFKPPVPVQLSFSSGKGGTSHCSYGWGIWASRKKYKEPVNYKGIDFACSIFLKQGVETGWSGSWEEKSSGLTIPTFYNGIHLTTIIHEFAHALTFEQAIRKHKKGTWYEFAQKDTGEWIRGHKKPFRKALQEILIACMNGDIPIVKKLDERAIVIHKLLLTTDLGKKIKEAKKEEDEKLLAEKEARKKPRDISKINKGWFGRFILWGYNNVGIEVIKKRGMEEDYKEGKVGRKEWGRKSWEENIKPIYHLTKKEEKEFIEKLYKPKREIYTEKELIALYYLYKVFYDDEWANTWDYDDRKEREKEIMARTKFIREIRRILKEKYNWSVFELVANQIYSSGWDYVIKQPEEKNLEVGKSIWFNHPKTITNTPDGKIRIGGKVYDNIIITQKDEDDWTRRSKYQW